MKDIQSKQTMADIARLYSADIGPADEALKNRLMSERQALRKRNSGPFKDLPRKSQLQDLTHNQNWFLHLSLMLDWMHYQTRCIVPLYRNVRIAKGMRGRHPEVINEIVSKLQNGGSLKHRVSRTVLKEFKAKELREDPLLWNWNIHHFHLGDFDHDKGFATGTDELLFVYVDNNSAVLLGFGTHSDFAARWLFDKLFETRPEFIKRFKMNGISGPVAQEWTDAERQKLWSNVGVTMTYQGHAVFPPGQGVVTSGHASRLVGMQAKLLRAIDQLDARNQIGSRDYAPIRIKFDGTCLNLWKRTELVWQGQPLT